MKFRYEEEDLKRTIREQVFPEAAENVSAFKLNHIAIGQIIKVSGERNLERCVLDIDENGLLLILMHDLKVDKAVGHIYLEFSHMQGIKIKEGILFYKITLQFIDGRSYVIRMQKRNMKTLPNQGNNSEKIVHVLHDQDLGEMDNVIRKKNTIRRRASIVLYWVTFIPVLLIAIGIATEIDSTALALGVISGTVFVHLIISSFVQPLINPEQDRKFSKEHTTVMESYNKTNDANLLLSDLSNLQHQPTTQESRNAFNLSMALASYRTDEAEEAVSYLDAVETTNEELLMAIKEQRDVFRGKCDLPRESNTLNNRT